MSLDEARANTKIIFEKLRSKDFNYKPVGNEQSSAFQNIANIDKTKIDDIWLKLEKGSTQMLDDRRRLIGKMVETESFDNFWRNHCKNERNRAVTFFYLGTGLMLLSVMVYIIAQFLHFYYSPVGAALGAGLIFCSLICGVVLKIQISALRPESFFHTKNKFVEVCEDPWILIYLWPERCSWRLGKLVDVPDLNTELINNDVSFKVAVDGEETWMPAWRIRDAKDDDASRPSSGSHMAFMSGKSIV